MRSLYALLAAAIVCGTANTSRADQILFDFQNRGATDNNTSFGTDTYTFGGIVNGSGPYTTDPRTLTAYGYDSNQSSVTGPLNLTATRDLYQKVSGFNETGLGLIGSPDHEISKVKTIALDFKKVLDATGSTSVTLTIGSIQSGEGFAIYESSSPVVGINHSVNTLVDAGVGGGNDSFGNLITSGKPYSHTFSTATKGDVFYISANFSPTNSNDVLINSATVSYTSPPTTTPEPSTIVMALTGVIAAIGYRRRRKRAAV